MPRQLKIELSQQRRSDTISARSSEIHNRKSIENWLRVFSVSEGSVLVNWMRLQYQFDPVKICAASTPRQRPIHKKKKNQKLETIAFCWSIFELQLHTIPRTEAKSFVVYSRKSFMKSANIPMVDVSPLQTRRIYFHCITCLQTIFSFRKFNSEEAARSCHTMSRWHCHADPLACWAADMLNVDNLTTRMRIGPLRFFLTPQGRNICVISMWTVRKLTNEKLKPNQSELKSNSSIFCILLNSFSFVL